MAEQRNLTAENVEELAEKLKEMQKTNPALRYRFFEYSEKDRPDISEDIVEWQSTMESVLIEKLFKKVEALERKIALIFGDHVLINGQFQDITRKINLK